MEQLITDVGLDVHKATIAVAMAGAGQRGDVREHGKIANTPTALKALAAKLGRGSGDLRFCYEAGPCGYGMQRQLTEGGHDCVVVAPSLIPRKPGDRIKTDRRDAINLARLHRAGELTPVWVPDQTHEAIRDLVPAPGSGAHPAPGAPAIVRLPAAPGPSLPPTGLDPDAPALAGRPHIRPTGASHRAGGLHRGGGGGDGPAGSAGRLRSGCAAATERWSGPASCRR